MPHKVLVADDDADIRLLVAATLQTAGYEVVEAADGQAAVEIALRELPVIAVLDVNMPHLTGFQVTAALRADRRTAQMGILILSARGAEADRITGFEEGADDYLVKPFVPRELQLRVGVLAARQSAVAVRHVPAIPATFEAPAPPVVAVATRSAPPLPDNVLPLPQTSTGHAALDTALGGGLPVGSNILLHGALGSGKSTLCRQFMAEGLLNRERAMFIAVDDAPLLVRQSLEYLTQTSTDTLEENNLFRLVDAYSWGAGGAQNGERYAVTGILELNQLSGVVQDAGVDLGQTVRNRLGGRRVLDSISSLLINFELPSVQRFLAQVARNAVAFGGVSTFFVIEEGTVDDKMLANIKYLMDGVIETRVENGTHMARVASMKWTPHARDWVNL